MSLGRVVKAQVFDAGFEEYTRWSVIGNDGRPVVYFVDDENYDGVISKFKFSMALFYINNGDRNLIGG